MKMLTAKEYCSPFLYQQYKMVVEENNALLDFGSADSKFNKLGLCEYHINVLDKIYKHKYITSLQLEQMIGDGLIDSSGTRINVKKILSMLYREGFLIRFHYESEFTANKDIFESDNNYTDDDCDNDEPSEDCNSKSDCNKKKIDEEIDSDIANDEMLLSDFTRKRTVGIYTCSIGGLLLMSKRFKNVFDIFKALYKKEKTLVIDDSYLVLSKLSLNQAIIKVGVDNVFLNGIYSSYDIEDKEGEKNLSLFLSEFLVSKSCSNRDNVRIIAVRSNPGWEEQLENRIAEIQVEINELGKKELNVIIFICETIYHMMDTFFCLRKTVSNAEYFNYLFTTDSYIKNEQLSKHVMSIVNDESGINYTVSLFPLFAS